VKTGKRKGEFRFVLKASNGEVIATSGTESYTQKHNLIEILTKHFINFAIEDLTKEKKI
jgi:hypothetical protein